MSTLETPPVITPPVITYATFSRRLGAFIITVLVDLFMYQLLDAVGVGKALPGLITAWLVIHHIGLVGEGGTVGQRLLALRVVKGDGTRVGAVRACWRLIVQMLAMLPLGLGLLWMLDEPRRRTWQDLAADTVVVFERSGVIAPPEWAHNPPWQSER